MKLGTDDPELKAILADNVVVDWDGYVWMDNVHLQPIVFAKKSMIQSVAKMGKHTLIYVLLI